LDLPRDAGFTLDAGVTSGDIHVDFPLQIEETETNRTVRGSHGGGEHLVRLRTTSGDIWID
jgi:lia operon protein LiaG